MDVNTIQKAICELTLTEEEKETIACTRDIVQEILEEMSRVTEFDVYPDESIALAELTEYEGVELEPPTKYLYRDLKVAFELLYDLTESKKIRY